MKTLSASSVRGLHLRATDGPIGTVKDLLFDDHSWTLRYLVVDTGKWLPGRRVLIAPESLIGSDPEHREIAISLTQDQVRASPPLEQHLPVSRQHERDLSRHYGWDAYWLAGLGDAIAPGPLTLPPEPYPAVDEGAEAPKEPTLRSVEEVSHYRLEATDGLIGHLEDFLIDEHTWSIRLLVVCTRNWWPGQKVLLAPSWIDHFDWRQAHVCLEMSRDEIRHSPQYDPEQPLTEDYYRELEDFYRHRRARFAKD